MKQNTFLAVEYRLALVENVLVDAFLVPHKVGKPLDTHRIYRYWFQRVPLCALSNHLIG